MKPVKVYGLLVWYTITGHYFLEQRGAKSAATIYMQNDKQLFYFCCPSKYWKGM